MFRRTIILPAVIADSSKPSFYPSSHFEVVAGDGKDGDTDANVWYGGQIASAQEVTVAPVVSTSSTRRMCLPHRRPGRRTERYPCTFSHRCRCSLSAWLGLCGWRRTLWTSTGTPRSPQCRGRCIQPDCNRGGGAYGRCRGRNDDIHLGIEPSGSKVRRRTTLPFRACRQRP